MKDAENELEELKTWMIKIILTKKTLHKFRFLNKYTWWQLMAAA